MAIITDQSFYKYLKCPSWLIREAKEGGDLRDRLLAKIQEEGLMREKELALLKDREISEVDLDDADEAATRTLELMKEGAATIYKGVLQHHNWVARPDILERVEGKSDLGDYYYIACDVKRSLHLKDEYKFQGAFYAEVLAKLQGTKPTMGYVIHPDGEAESYSLTEFSTAFHLTLDRIEDILAGNVETHFLTSGCKQSPYFTECQTETKECEDLSLLKRVWRSEVDALENFGITTVEELANASMDRLQEVPDVTMDRLYFLQQQAISLVENRVIRLGEIDLPEEDGAVLIVDVESDPLRAVHYLFGVLKIDGGEETYHTFFADDPADEEKAWHKFTAFLAENAKANLYHYGWYEVDVFRKLTETYGAPENVKQQFTARMIDVLTFMRGKVIFPTPFYSLKDIAKHLGFDWRTKEASGLDSILWYEEWLEKRDEAIKKDIIEYNEDDVRATWFVREWAMKA